MRGDIKRMLALPLATLFSFWLLAGLCMERLGVLQQQGSAQTRGIALKVDLLQQLLSSSDAEEQAWRSLHSATGIRAQLEARQELERQAGLIKRMIGQLHTQPGQDGDLLQSLQDTRTEYLRALAGGVALSPLQMHAVRQSYFNSMHALLDVCTRQLQRADGVLQLEFWRACQYVMGAGLFLSMALIGLNVWRWRQAQREKTVCVESGLMDAAQLAHLAIEKARQGARLWSQQPGWSKRGEVGGI
ncbi:hypothetical protein V8J88_24015 [Massilia sp. W12]|uniref:hypothetical protein n=1 Tax=Massilia sp. W12 TaxID=3126507 RepID=UPI0030CD053E